MAYLRRGAGRTLLVAVNMQQEPAAVILPEREGGEPAAEGREVLLTNGESVTVQEGNLVLDGWQAVVMAL